MALETIKNIILFILFVYSIVISVLYWSYYVNKDANIKDAQNALTQRSAELDKRESIVVDKEICFRELTRLKTIQDSALDILKQYNIQNNRIDSEIINSEIQNNNTR